MPFRFAICQELFEDWTWDRQCHFIAETGYTGIEVAPFSLAKTPDDLSSTDRQKLRSVAESNGLAIVGLHWLLAKTQGLHLTSPDPATRKRTAEYLRKLTTLCADLGGNVLVFGSPAQRSLEPGVDKATGLSHALEVFEALVPHLEKSGVTLCVEPLTPKETNFINTCADAVEIIRRINHPCVQLHQDVKAMLSEPTPVPQLIRDFAPFTKHFHVNDSNLLGPGMGETDYRPIFQTLHDTRYSAWVSVEVFDYKPGAEYIARTSLHNMRATLAQLGLN